MKRITLEQIYFHGYYDGPLQGVLLSEDQDAFYFELAFASAQLTRRLFLLRQFATALKAEEIEPNLLALMSETRRHPPTHFGIYDLWIPGRVLQIGEIAQPGAAQWNAADNISIWDVSVVRSIPAICRKLSRR